MLEDLNDDTAIPDVLGCVQEILSTIFVSMYNHHDAEERCFSDCLAELPEYDTVEDKKVLSSFSIVDISIHQQKCNTSFLLFSIQVRALNLDLIKRRLDRFLYKRLDLFQRDIFSVLERARNLSRTDSQIFEDSYELQKHFIKVRDEVNKILSPMKWFIDVSGPAIQFQCFYIIIHVFVIFQTCKHGELLQSRALLYTQSDLKKSVDDLRAQKQV